ncbi:hypothetical protein Tco_0758376 [Tanacetum coccineum]
MERFARLYIEEIVARHGVHVSIISDRDSYITSGFLAITAESIRNATGSKYRLPSLNRWPKIFIQQQLPLEREVCPFEELYGRKCQTPIAWAESLEFNVGDKVLLKVSPWKGVVRFGKRSKLSPRYVEPFEIVERVGPVAYRLRLPQALIGNHDKFHVSNLKKFLADVNLHVPLEEIKIDNGLRFFEEPVEVMDRGVKKLKQSKIPIVKIRWNSLRGPEFIWEREDEMKRKYPQLFVSATA